MDQYWIVWTWPLVGGIIGWITNKLAIMMLFRPRRPRRIPLTGFVLQGLLPKRRSELAERVAEVVQTRLMPVDGLLKQLDLPAVKTDLMFAVRGHVRERLERRWPRFLPHGIKEAVEPLLEDAVEREASLLFDRLTAETEVALRERLDAGTLAREQLDALDLAELEAVVHALARRELLHIEWMGAVLGAAVGFVQVGIWHLTTWFSLR